MSLLVTVLALALLFWFAGGTIWNVRRGRELMRWMQDGLPLLGERTTVRWLGSTAVEMVIRKANPPFEEAAVVIFLEPRDVPWMWALSRGRGRRDTVIVRGTLRVAPRADLEALDRESWSGRDALRSMGGDQWSLREPAARGGLATFYRAPAALPRADAMLELAARAGLTVRRLSVRRGGPHLQVHVDPPGAGVSASQFFEAVRALGARAPA
ncbi:MAG TPA: hypothetical protein VFR85_06005 [Anaeromyxobacteraceae bacterium]|nr:hypothetical protein [Anaeromyxobacteraceae bacterium]